MSLSFVVYGKAEPAGSKTRGVTKGGRQFVRDANPNAKDWKRAVAAAAGDAMDGRALFDGPLDLSVRFFRPRPSGHFNAKRELNAQGRRMPYPTTKPDTTKLLRAVEDALIGVVLRDDAQIVGQVACKLYGEPARCEITVSAASVQ